jgi:hypothetical protein
MARRQQQHGQPGSESVVPLLCHTTSLIIAFYCHGIQLCMAPQLRATDVSLKQPHSIGSMCEAVNTLSFVVQASEKLFKLVLDSGIASPLLSELKENWGQLVITNSLQSLLSSIFK